MTETLQRKFVKPTSISDSLKCTICSEVFIEATRLFCSHTFCNQCIKRWLKVNDLCPICRTKIDRKNMGPDLIAQGIIGQLQVFCPVEDCPQKVLNCFLEEHYENQCTTRDKVKQKNTGKSHKKPKIFNFQMSKDEEVQQKINANLIKGSYEARLEAARRRINPRQSGEGLLSQNRILNQEAEKKQVKKTGNYDFLEELLNQ